MRWRLSSLRPASDWARTIALIVGLGLSFGFIGVAAGIAWEVLVAKPSGVAEQDYVTVGSRGTESRRFGPVSTIDYELIRHATPGLNWSFASRFVEQAQIADAPERATR